MKLGIITALPAELRSLPAPLRRFARCGGIGVINAEHCARQLIEQNVDALISYGVAGALCQEFKIGAIIEPSTVVNHTTGEYFATAALSNRYKTFATLLTVQTPVLQAENKTALAQQFDAHAVDMESCAVARLAAQHQLPFYCVRAISDSSTTNLPPEILPLMNANAHTTTLLKALTKRPSLTMELIRMGLNYRHALRALTEYSQQAIVPLVEEPSASRQSHG